MKISRLVLSGMLVLAALTSCSRSGVIVIENDAFKYVIGRDGKNIGFTAKDTGADWCSHDTESYCATVKRGDREYPVSSVSLRGDRITLKFAEPGVTAVVKTSTMSDHIVFEVESVEGDAESLVFINIPLTLKGMPGEPFAACAYSLNLKTNVMQLPALQSHLWAACYSRFGMNGAKAALIGVPGDRILTVIRGILTSQTELPYTKLAGAWAQEVPFNHGSYLFNFGSLTEKNVDEWIDMVHSLGFNQIDNHGGGSGFFRFGDFHLNEEKFPGGWDSYKRIVARLHEAGIGSIFHTYAFFIDKQSKYVTPVPHPHLAAFRSFTLAAPVSSDAKEITVDESTADVSTITGFFERNSVTLHIGDELVTFTGVSKEAPYTFTGCTRGAYGTTPSSHPKGAQARHLKECFGLLVPEPESDLFNEIAARHAEIIDYCGFDGFYLDAIDGSDILGGGDYAWYYGQEFVFEIYKNLKKPVSMEMSSMWHHMWNFRSRWQAWDYPNRGQKRFIDIHAKTVDCGLLLPLHFGWWNFQVWSPPQIEPSFPDVIEYVGCKLIGYNAGLSLTGAVSQENLRTIPAYRRLVDLLKTYEDLRHDNYFDESVKARLREPGKEFTLFKDSSGAWRFRPASYERHRIENLDHPSRTWETENSFGSQPVKLRIEALMSAGSCDAPGAITLADFPGDTNSMATTSAENVTFTVQPSTEQSKAGLSGARLTASSSGKTPQNAAWARIEKKFDPWLDLDKNQAIGVWIYGDGQGELINFRLESPKHISYGAVADHYVTVDFTGWRYVELIETESERWNDYVWQDGKWLYNVYRELISFKTVESLSIWYNNIPPGKEVSCSISTVKAVPMVPATLRNPSVTVGGKTIVFPVAMKSGSYIEFYSPSDCTLYGPKGEILSKVKPQGDVPVFENGKNTMTFSCVKPDGLSARAQVTVISYGEPL
ncbi:hypothetical protein LLG96_12765 [bacterium]|nr:hypothetical protein [bacterium]